MVVESPICPPAAPTALRVPPFINKSLVKGDLGLQLQGLCKVVQHLQRDRSCISDWFCYVSTSFYFSKRLKLWFWRFSEILKCWIFNCNFRSVHFVKGSPSRTPSWFFFDMSARHISTNEIRTSSNKIQYHFPGSQTRPWMRLQNSERPIRRQ